MNKSEASQSVNVSQEKFVQTESKATSKRRRSELSIKLEINNEEENKILIELFPEKAPQHVNQFLRLVNESFYDGLIFHRVIPNFVIQAGGYNSELKYFSSEQKIRNESFNGLKNAKHTVAMARLSKPDSRILSSLLILETIIISTAQKESGYTVFGKVIDGFEIIEEIELQDTESREGFLVCQFHPSRLLRQRPATDKGKTLTKISSLKPPMDQGRRKKQISLHRLYSSFSRLIA